MQTFKVQEHKNILLKEIKHDIFNMEKNVRTFKSYKEINIIKKIKKRISNLEEYIQFIKSGLKSKTVNNYHNRNPIKRYNGNNSSISSRQFSLRARENDNVCFSE